MLGLEKVLNIWWPSPHCSQEEEGFRKGEHAEQQRAAKLAWTPSPPSLPPEAGRGPPGDSWNR